MFAQLMERRIPHFLGLYLGSGWVLLEFSDWVVQRYLLSPYWVDLVLMVWLLLLPTVLIVTWFHGKPGPDPWTRGQRLIVGANVFLAAAVLLVLASNRDLGAMAERVSVVDETGAMQERMVAKSEYRRRIGFFMLDNQTGDTELDWMEMGLPILMELDLYQDVFLDIRGPEHFAGMLAEAGVADQSAVPISLQRQLADRQYMEWFATGYLVAGDTAPQMHVTLHNTATGESNEPIVVSTENLFSSIDEVTQAVRRALDVPTNYSGATRDLPVAQLITESEAAFRDAALGYRAAFVDKDWSTAAEALKRATLKDPGYAHAQIGLYTTLMAQNKTGPAIEAMNAAIANLYRLPERVQFLAKTEYFVVAKQDVASAITVLEMATTLYPADVDAWYLLGAYNEGVGNRDKAIHAFSQLLVQDPNRLDALIQVGKLHQSSGAYEDARRHYLRYLEARPTDVQGPLQLGGLASAQGEHTEALRHYKTASLIDPTDPGIATKVAAAHFNLGAFDPARAELEEARGVTQTPAQTAEVELALLSHHLRRGQVALAVEHFLAYRQALSESVPPLLLAIRQQEGLDALLAANRADDLAAMVDALANLAPPINKMAHALRLRIATKYRDLEEIKASLVGMDSLIESLGRAEFTSLRRYGKGVQAELEGDLEGALAAYDEALEIAPLQSRWHEDAARVLRKSGKLKAAAERIGMALTVNPMSGELNVEAARIALARGDTATAQRYLDAADTVWSNADADYGPAQLVAELRDKLPPRG